MAKTPTKAPHLRVVTGSPEKKTPARKKNGGGDDGNKGGRPPHEPTEATRTIVNVLRAAGFAQEAIADVIGMSVTTLKVHYGEELRTGVHKANAKIAASLFQIATNPAHPRCVTAAIFWAKNRMGWKDVNDGDGDGDEVPTITIGIGEKRGA